MTNEPPKLPPEGYKGSISDWATVMTLTEEYLESFRREAQLEILDKVKLERWTPIEALNVDRRCEGYNKAIEDLEALKEQLKKSL